MALEKIKKYFIQRIIGFDFNCIDNIGKAFVNYLFLQACGC